MNLLWILFTIASSNQNTNKPELIGYHTIQINSHCSQSFNTVIAIIIRKCIWGNVGPPSVKWGPIGPDHGLGEPWPPGLRWLHCFCAGLTPSWESWDWGTLVRTVEGKLRIIMEGLCSSSYTIVWPDNSSSRVVNV